MSRLVVLKPIVTSRNGYKGPAGVKAVSGYADEHGFGHEEWNGHPDWIWKGQRVFHTESQPMMWNHAETGDLGIIMVARINKKPHAIGAAMAVSGNSDKDRRAIAKALALREKEEQIWAVPEVQAAHADQQEFHQAWLESYHWILWRCDPTHYVIFDKPIEIVPGDIFPALPGESPRQDIAKRHKQCQAIRPDQARAILSPELSPAHPIMIWLSTGKFDLTSVGKLARKAPPPKGGAGSSAGSASADYVRYIERHEVRISPRHTNLQKSFVKWLKTSGVNSVESDIGRVDVRFTDQVGKLVFAEIKPTEIGMERFAIRLAIGQLLDYRHQAGLDPDLMIVVESPPDQGCRELALTNGFSLAWPTTDGSFEVKLTDRKTRNTL